MDCDGVCLQGLFLSISFSSFLKFIFRADKSTITPATYHLERETRVIPVANHRAGRGAGRHGRAILPKTNQRRSQ